MSGACLRIVVLGLSLSSSWGNGHATTYRSLLRELADRGHEVLFLERDQPSHAAHRDTLDFGQPQFALYRSLEELFDRFGAHVRESDATIVGSGVPDGVAVGDWVLATARGVRAFYDIDTPVTLARLRRGDCGYLAPRQVRGYDLYLSFSGAPTLLQLASGFGATRARVLYCSVDPSRYRPHDRPPRWDLGYMGTFSDDRQPTVEALLLEPARHWAEGDFVVAGPRYPATIDWPGNVARIAHVPPQEHRAFYGAQRFALNVTRTDMIAAGWSPSVRLFEAAACATPIISDGWPGLEELFVPGREIIVATGPQDVLAALRGLGEDERMAVGARARARVLAGHTAAHRAETLEQYLREAAADPAWRRGGRERTG